MTAVATKGAKLRMLRGNRKLEIEIRATHFALLCCRAMCHYHIFSFCQTLQCFFHVIFEIVHKVVPIMILNTLLRF